MGNWFELIPRRLRRKRKKLQKTTTTTNKTKQRTIVKFKQNGQIGPDIPKVTFQTKIYINSRQHKRKRDTTKILEKNQELVTFKVIIYGTPAEETQFRRTTRY